MSPSSPTGSLEQPLSACAFALGAGARFVARSVDTMQKHLVDVLKRAHQHHGASFTEIFQNCIVFNDKAFADFTDKTIAADRQVHLQHGAPLLFGKDMDKGLRLRPGTLQLEAVTIGANGVTEDDILIHDENDRALAQLLVAMEPPGLPVALGVVYCDPAPAYEDQVESRLDAACCGDLNDLLRAGRTWQAG